jgi:molybdate transport system substrate-binding protein
MKRVWILLLGLVLLAGCGGSNGNARPSASRLKVFAAAALRTVLPKLDDNPRYRFDASKALEIGIRQGAEVDVFVSADPKYLAEVQSKGLLLDKPVQVAFDRIVLIVPRHNPARIAAPPDLARPGVRLAIAPVGAPAGDDARKSLAEMHLDSALQNAIGTERSVESVVADVVSGDADAGFVYGSQWKTVASKVKKIPLPAAGRVHALYSAAVLKRSPNAQLARGFVALLQSPIAQSAFRDAGFGVAPVRMQKGKR